MLLELMKLIALFSCRIVIFTFKVWTYRYLLHCMIIYMLLSSFYNIKILKSKQSGVKKVSLVPFQQSRRRHFTKWKCNPFCDVDDNIQLLVCYLFDDPLQKKRFAINRLGVISVIKLPKYVQGKDLKTNYFLKGNKITKLQKSQYFTSHSNSNLFPLEIMSILFLKKHK